MQLALAQALVDALENDGNEVRLDEHYSGRGMYGKMTAGVVCDNAAAIAPAILNNLELFVDEELIEDLIVESKFDVVNHFRTDSMGLGVIVY